MMDDAFEKHKVCVLIPTFNNAQTLAVVLQSVLEYTTHVIVINDGSTDNTLELLGKFPTVPLVNYLPNQGKGYALRQGFKKAVACGYDYAISIDSDGQHFADDLPLFLAKLENHPDAIIIGARNMDQSSVPGSSSFGNKFSNFWYSVETGLTMSDTQSGYRLYPVRLLEKFSFLTKKYEFEIEVIVRAAWSGMEVTEVPVKVYYPEKEVRISHFRPFIDVTRITILNTCLVLITWFYIMPRNLIRSIKKKILSSSFVSNFSTLMNRTH